MDIVNMQYRNELIKLYFGLGLKHSEILSFLTLRHNITLSRTQLKRILKRLRLFRRTHFNDLHEVAAFIKSELQRSGRLHGYRWMHLKCLQHGLVVKQNTVRLLLNEFDPEAVLIRRRHRLIRRNYFNSGPNFLWHIDGYDKLKPYGIAISGCIDGFSRYIVWLKASYTNNDPSVIAGYYMSSIEKLNGCPKTIRLDHGTENVYLKDMQTFLRDNGEHHGSPAFICGTSTHNQRIEAWWGILRKHNVQFLMDLFEDLKNQDYFNGTVIDKALIRFCFMDLIQSELDEVALEWNSHQITSNRNQRTVTGKPIIMYYMPEIYNTTNYLIEVREEDINICKELCTLVNIPCDKDVYDLCRLLVEENNYNWPNTAYDAVNFYIDLRNEILQLL